MEHRIALMRGDGVGPEIVEAALAVMRAVEEKFGMSFRIEEAPGGDSTLRESMVPLPEDSISVIRESHASLKGPVGETAMDVIVKLRQLFDLYVNLRPAKSFPNVPCLREDIDLLIVRENTEDLYRGMEFAAGESAVALRVITERASERIIDYGFKMARARRGKVTLVHKANVMRMSDGLFARVGRETSRRFQDVEFGEMYVDACAMNLIRSPQEFDVIITTNMFGDILSDEASQIVGGLGMAPSANLGSSVSLFEPVHGAATDIAGKRIANPIGMILSVKMMLEWLAIERGDPSCRTAADGIEKAVMETLRRGIRTPELGGEDSTQAVGSAIASAVLRPD